ncbi:MAG: hypothetical protein VYA30_13050 [Myxococcota bacterium]|nr:hypothetical protein [Myxococcota bacterium]
MIAFCSSPRPYRFIGQALLVFCLLNDPSAVSAQSRSMAPSMNDPIYVVVGRIDGISRVRRNQQRFERALSAHSEIRVINSRKFNDEAQTLGVIDMLPEDATSLERVCERVDIDAAIYVQVEPAGADSRVTVTVYAALEGRYVGEQVIRVPNGRMNTEVWQVASDAILPDLKRVLGQQQPSVIRRPAPINRRPRVGFESRNQRRGDARQRTRRGRELGRRIDELPVDDAVMAKQPRTASSQPIGEFRLGLMSLGRNFVYTASPESQVFNRGGIDYQLGLVPGFAIETHFKPFSRQRGAAKGLGLRLFYEKAFFRTQQTVTQQDQSQTTTLLDSRHDHFGGYLTYTHSFGAKGELGGYLGFGHLIFELSENQEYTGTSYTYLDTGISGFVPFGTQLLGFSGRAGLIPYGSLGDTVQELGGAATVFGYRVYLGLESRFDFGLILSGGFEYTAFGSTVTGTGRDGRIGESADDHFMVLRFQGGYRF